MGLAAVSRVMSSQNEITLLSLQLILTQTGAYLILISSFFQSLEQKLWGGDVASM